MVATASDWFTRFIPKVEFLPSGCWQWKASLKPHGYGSYRKSGKSIPAHIYAWELVNGEREGSVELHHVCLNKGCVNPDHLRPLTRKQHAAEHGLSGAALTASLATHCTQNHAYEEHGGTMIVNGRACRRCLICRREKDRLNHRKRRGDSS